MDPMMLMALMSAGKQAGSGLSGILSGLFGNSSAPYERAEETYRDFLNQAQNIQNPFYKAGTGAIPQFQEWLSGQKDPSQFINNLMGQYQESPYAKIQQQRSLRSAQNMGSASGLTGSTPLTQFAEQQSRDISSQDMGNWLQRVLGINTQYGQGLESLMGRGQTSANAITDLLRSFGQNIAESRYGQEAGKNFDWSNLIGGLINLI